MYVIIFMSSVYINMIYDKYYSEVAKLINFCLEMDSFLGSFMSFALDFSGFLGQCAGEAEESC